MKLCGVAGGETRAVLADNAGAPGHIFNLGHGITPNAKIECMQALVEAVHGA